MNRISGTLTGAVFCAGFLLAQTTIANASTIFFDDFGGDALGLAQTTLANWNVASGSVDVIGTGFYDLAGNGIYVDLDGSTGSAATISTKQSFDFELSQQYLLEFDYAKNGTAGETITFEVTMGNLLSQLVLLPGALGSFQHFSQSFFGNGETAKLIIGALGGDNQGPIIDNVRLSVVPLPAALPMLAGGVALLGWLGARGKRKRLAA